MVVAGSKCVPSAEEFPSFPLVTTTNLWEPVMATITELARAKMITAMALAIGEEEANVLATALNLDGQLASRYELQTELLATREELRAVLLGVSLETQSLRDEMRAGLAATNEALRTGLANSREELQKGLKAASLETQNLRDELRTGLAATNEAIRVGLAAANEELQKGLQGASVETQNLRDEMRAGFLLVSREKEELRRDLEASIAGLRSDVDAKIDGLKDSMVREMHRQTRQLFVGMISLMATIFAMLGGLLAITGKL